MSIGLPNLHTWIKRKAPMRSVASRIRNTESEPRNWQRSDLPRTSAKWPALPVSRLTRCVGLERGDTIVEILVSMAILSMVFGAAFASSGKSLREGTDASNRNQALTIAEQQIAIIKNSAQTAGAPPAYPNNQPFCLKPDGEIDTTGIDPILKACQLPNQTFAVVVNYDAAKQTFKVTSSWPGANNIRNEVELYYHSTNTKGG